MKVRTRHYAKYTTPRRSGKKLPPGSFPVAAWRFREARLQCGLGTLACAELLHVSERTVRNWEAGAFRIPYAAYKLMRVLRGGKHLGVAWAGWYVHQDKLTTPEGHVIEAHGMAWWSLLVRQARLWRDQYAKDNAPCNAPQPLLGSKRELQDVLSKENQHSGPILTPELGSFHRSKRATDDQHRAARPVGPSSNTGQNPAQLPCGAAQ